MASNNKTQQKIEGLQSDDVKVRKKAARWLGRKGTYDALAYLLAALNDSSWSVRRNAVVALGKIGEAEVVEPLIVKLSDRTVSVRRAAIQALGRIRDPRATEGLVRLHAHAQLGADAIQALIQIGASALLICCDRMLRERTGSEPMAGMEPPSRLIQVGPSTLLIRRDRIQLHDTEPPSPWMAAARQMILRGADRLLIEVLSAEGWSGQQRWQVLDYVRKIQGSLPFFEVWSLTKFSRITDIPSWCERASRELEQPAVRSGSKQILDYIMLGRASQRDYATEGEELLRAAGGTKECDTGETLLRAADRTIEAPGNLSFLGRLRRWLKQED